MIIWNAEGILPILPRPWYWRFMTWNARRRWVARAYAAPEEKP